MSFRKYDEIGLWTVFRVVRLLQSDADAVRMRKIFFVFFAINTTVRNVNHDRRWFPWYPLTPNLIKQQKTSEKWPISGPTFPVEPVTNHEIPEKFIYAYIRKDCDFTLHTVDVLSDFESVRYPLEKLISRATSCPRLGSSPFCHVSTEIEPVAECQIISLYGDTKR